MGFNSGFKGLILKQSALCAKDVVWVQLAYTRHQWEAAVNMVIILHVLNRDPLGGGVLDQLEYYRLVKHQCCYMELGAGSCLTTF